MAWSAEWDANGSSLSSTDGNTCRRWMPDGDGNWFCTDIFEEVGVGAGGGGGGGERKMVVNRNDEVATAPASISAVGAPPPTGAAVPSAWTVPEVLEF